MAYHVYIERPADPSPAGRSRLSAAIAQRYKLPEAQVDKHLESGRLRVKSNVDETTARKFAAELTAMGAIVAVVDATTGAPLATPPAPVAPAARPQSPPQQKYESGLSAAFAPGAAQAPASLGALEKLGGPGGALPPISLASLDGADESAPEELALSVATPAAPPALALEVEREEKPGANAKGGTMYKPPPKNAFAAPEDEEPPLQLAVEPPKKPAPPPPAPAAPPPAKPSGARDAFAPSEDDERAPALDLDVPKAAAPPPRPVPPPPVEPAAPVAPRRATAARNQPDEERGAPLARYFEGRERHRLLAGLGLALLLGYLPATLYASSAEKDQYGVIRRELEAEQATVETREQWEALDATRHAALKRMESARDGIQLKSAVIWLVFGAGVGFAWFKKLT